MYNYSKLKGRIIEIYGTQAKFAEELGMRKGSFSNKINNKRNFTQDEITKAIGLLSIDNPIPYFFTKEVNK